MVQGVHGMEAVTNIPHGDPVKMRGWVRALSRSWNAHDPTWYWVDPSAKRPTRASVCKRARHAKRPDGRRRA